MSRTKRYGTMWLTHAVLILGAFTMVFPFFWQIWLSLMSNAEVTAVPPTLIPAQFKWQNYVTVFERIPFLNQFWNSVLITVIRTIGQVVLCSLAGYAFARMHFRGRGALLAVVLSILMVPGQIYLLPQYQLIQGMHLLDTTWGIVLPGIFSAFGTFLMRQFFVGLPNELEESARLDGANPFQIFYLVMLPLAKPAISAVVITTVLWSWNDLLWPLVVTSQDKSMPLSVGIAMFAGRDTTDYSVMMAAATMAMAPILILFVALQRRVIEGLAHTGLKG
ncbi:MAG: carbohydrate ABC transporter permease [Propionibacteriaceae bacterium]|nr:carbohydrate ABC transporter permease [Micropruina sp.]